MILVVALAAGPGWATVQAGDAAVVEDVLVPEEGAGAAYLGVRLREETDHPEGGARVTYVVEGSPAAEAGIGGGDVVVAFDGHVIRGPLALTEKIQAHAAGDEISITVLRNGSEKTLQVRLGDRLEPFVAPGDGGLAYAFPFSSEGRWRERQDDVQKKLEELRRRLGDRGLELEMRPLAPLPPLVPLLSWGRPKLGVQLVETTRELRRHLGGEDDAGVLVSKVLTATPAERAGLAVGDLLLVVDGQKVASPDALVEALEDKVGKTFSIELVRDGRRLRVEVTIPDPDAERPTGPRA